MERSPRSEGYVLRGGRAGAERLCLLNRVKWPTTEPRRIDSQMVDIWCPPRELGWTRGQKMS
jgi:hypothetical protein